MINNQISFSRQLIKGKIAETIFEQMLRDVGIFTVLSFGYENILPELAHRHNDVKDDKNVKGAMEVIRKAPDFAVINNETHEVHLVEVKYRYNYNPKEILLQAKRMYETWKPSVLFIATPKGFFFDKVSEIVKNNGEIKRLNHPQISDELQQNYTELLNEFINKDKQSFDEE